MAPRPAALSRATPPPWVDADLYVVVSGSGPVTVHYGGTDAQVRHRVQAAVAALRTSR